MRKSTRPFAFGLPRAYLLWWRWVILKLTYVDVPGVSAREARMRESELELEAKIRDRGDRHKVRMISTFTAAMYIERIYPLLLPPPPFSPFDILTLTHPFDQRFFPSPPYSMIIILLNSLICVLELHFPPPPMYYFV